MTVEVREVAEGVYAYEQAPGGWCVSNAGIVVGGDGALVVDTLSTIPRARRLAEWVDKLAAGPGRTVVNTHFHGDHAFGNQVFAPGTRIIAHEDMRSAMVTTGLALTGLWPRVDWGEIELRPPNVTFRDRLTLHVGERQVELICVGPAHTDHDVVVWLPEERVLFAGTSSCRASLRSPSSVRWPARWPRSTGWRSWSPRWSSAGTARWRDPR